MKIITFDNTVSVDKLRGEIIALNERCSSFLKVSEVFAPTFDSYSFRVFDPKGNCLLFVSVKHNYED